jgi:hypothetical protein
MNTYPLVTAAVVLFVQFVVWLSMRANKFRIDQLKLRIRPFGWKYFPFGPEVGKSFSPTLARSLDPDVSSRRLIIFADSFCNVCDPVIAAVSILLDEFSDLRVTIVTDGVLDELNKDYRVKHEKNVKIIKDLEIGVIPFVVYLEDGICVRKGLVNNLEQTRLLIDPAAVELDMQLI